MFYKAFLLIKEDRLNLRLVVDYLGNRDKRPHVYEWKNLNRVMYYVQETKDLPLMLGAENVHIVKRCINAAFPMHPYMRSYTVVMKILDKVVLYSSSISHKFNTNISTNANIVGTNYLLPHRLQTRYFLETQGFIIKDSSIYQGNHSMILLEGNGRGCIINRTQHILLLSLPTPSLKII